MSIRNRRSSADKNAMQFELSMNLFLMERPRNSVVSSMEVKVIELSDIVADVFSPDDDDLCICVLP